MKSLDHDSPLGDRYPNAAFALRRKVLYRTRVPPDQVWFFGSGIALALMGILNLLNRRYGLVASGLRATCIVCNVVLLCFAVVAGRLTGATVVEQVVLTSVLLSALILSGVRSASLTARAA